MEKTSIIEALIFSTNRGLDISQLTKFTEFSKTEVESLLNELHERYEKENHGIRLKRVGKKYGFFTKEEYAEYVERLVRRPVEKLTPSQLEVLAIVAKNGNSTKSQIELVRGKDCSNQLLELMLSGLLKRKRVKAPGRPYAYSVTDNFYEIFKMSDLELYEELGEDLPNAQEETEHQTNTKQNEEDEGIELKEGKQEIVEEDEKNEPVSPDKAKTMIE